MIIIRCDRCGNDGDLHSRTLEVSPAHDMSTMADTDQILHLCGYCWSKVQQLINTPDTKEQK